jgi:hypothetical protein
MGIMIKVPHTAQQLWRPTEMDSHQSMRFEVPAEAAKPNPNESLLASVFEKSRLRSFILSIYVQNKLQYFRGLVRRSRRRGR